MSNTNTPQTIKHNNRSQNRDYNIFVEEYFGGSDVFIYVNGKRSHNIAAVSFQIAEQHKPIYGYGSRTFDDLAVGTRIVSGALRIPIRNTDESDFGETWGRESNSRATARVSVPDWVYNYAPQKTDNVVVTKNEDKDTLSMIAKVQGRLGLDTSGFMDEATRRSVNQYRISNGMMLGTLIDNELLCHLGIEDYECKAVRRIHMYDSPMKTRSIRILEKDEGLVYLASDDEMVMVRTKDGMAGYVGVGDVYRK